MMAVDKEQILCNVGLFLPRLFIETTREIQIIVARLNFG